MTHVHNNRVLYLKYTLPDELCTPFPPLLLTKPLGASWVPRRAREWACSPRTAAAAGERAALPRARALTRTAPPRVRLPAAAEPPHCPYCGVPTAVASRAGNAPRHSPGLCEMTEELPERLAAAESVLQPGAVVQLQGDADLHSEARGAGEGTAGSRGGPPRAPGAPTTRAYCVFPHRELPGLAAVCHAAMSTNVPRFLNFF